jgi:DNA-binding transcriptional LysR family regulator
MDLRVLRHVVVLSRLLSYTKAAEELRITQSALSRSIQAIERDANVQLFDRDRGGVHLTVVGRSFASAAAALLREADELERMLKHSASGHAGEVRFGIAPLPAKALLTRLLQHLLPDMPELRTKVMVRSTDALLADLLAEKIEFLICSEGQLPDETQLKRSLLGWFPASLLVRDKHPVLDEPAAELRRYPLISTGPLTGHMRWPAYLRAYLSGPVHVIEDHVAVARVTESTDAIWICSSFAAIEELRANRLREVSAAQGQTFGSFRVYMYSLDKRSLSPAATQIKSRLQAIIRKLASERPRSGSRQGGERR